MKIDNTSKLADLCNFNPTKSYYKFVCLIRWKNFKCFPEVKALEKIEKLEKQLAIAVEVLSIMKTNASVRKYLNR